MVLLTLHNLHSSRLFHFNNIALLQKDTQPCCQVVSRLHRAFGRGGGRGEGGRLQVRSSTLSLQCTLTVLVVHSHDESCEEVLSSENALLRGFQQK